jgi:hypothetical protein
MGWVVLGVVIMITDLGGILNRPEFLDDNSIELTEEVSTLEPVASDSSLRDIKDVPGGILGWKFGLCGLFFWIFHNLGFSFGLWINEDEVHNTYVWIIVALLTTLDTIFFCSCFLLRRRTKKHQDRNWKIQRGLIIFVIHMFVGLAIGSFGLCSFLLIQFCYELEKNSGGSYFGPKNFNIYIIMAWYSFTRYGYIFLVGDAYLFASIGLISSFVGSFVGKVILRGRKSIETQKCAMILFWTGSLALFVLSVAKFCSLCST